MSESPRNPGARGLRRVLFLGLAGVFFVLAVLGAFLPVLPTTPFLLLTSGFLVRSSPSLHARLLRSRLFGGLIRDWEATHGVRPHVKLTAVGVMSAVVGFGLLGSGLSTVWRVVLGVVAAVGFVVVLRLPTIKD